MAEQLTDVPATVQANGQSKVPVTMDARGVVIKSLDELWRFSTMLASSDLAPKGYGGKPANVAIAIQMGHEIGLRPMQAVQNIAVINGRPSVWGDAVVGLVEASGLLEDFDEHFEGDGVKMDDGYMAVCIVKRKGRSKPSRTDFSVADAKRAGLWNKEGPWKTYPKRMLQMRARGFALRDTFADVLKGLMLAEEAQDFIDITPTPTPQPQQSRASALADKLAAQQENTMAEPTADEPTITLDGEVINTQTGELEAA